MNDAYDIRARVGMTLAALLVVSAVYVTAGCASSNRTGISEKAAAEPRTPLDEKALMALEDIEPVITPPQAPEAVPALSERAVRRLSKARELVAEQRFTEASIELERAMRYDPNHPQIHAALALLHWQARNTGEGSRATGDRGGPGSHGSVLRARPVSPRARRAGRGHHGVSHGTAVSGLRRGSGYRGADPVSPRNRPFR